MRPHAPLRPLLIVLVMVLAACSPASTTSGPVATPTVAPASATVARPTATPAPAFPLTLADDEGTAVTIESEPQVIVSLTPAATETLFALGVGDRIAGKSQDVLLYPPEAGPIPEVATFDGVDVERIVGMEPDLVVAGGNFFTSPDAIKQLRDLGLPVLVTYAATVDGAFSDIELLGAAIGRLDAATTMTATMRKAFADVEAAVANAPRPRVFYELDATGAIYGPADNSFLAAMIKLAGGDPITTGSPVKYDIPIEQLIAADPELILLADAAYGATPELVAARPGWDVMTAVKTEGAIRPIDDTTVTRPGPRLFLGLELLARTIHPELTIPEASPIPPVP
ncbi:MAG: ABC transporter substrate-binding protein [Chloroflexi bacterium]|nr:ABC transporter substrate-binding protein [Chloroflexota bacterium]